jgi:hypothetical protein
MVRAAALYHRLSRDRANGTLATNLHETDRLI